MKKKILNPKVRFDLISLVYLSLSGLIALSLFSYSSKDLSLNSKHYNWDEATQNLFGYTGSFLSDALLQVFGLGAWGFVLFFFWLFWNRLTPDENKADLEKVLFFFVGLFSSCLGLGFFKDFYLYDGLIFSGGWIGKVVFNALYPVVSGGGLFAFVAVTLLLTLLVFAEKSLDEVLLKPWSWDWISHFKIKRKPKTKESPETSVKSEAPSFSLQSSSASEEKLNLKTQEPVEDENTLLTMPQIKRTDSSKLTTQIPKVTSHSDEGWELPPLEFLGEVPSDSQSNLKDEEIQKKAKLLQTKLEQFNVKGQITGIKTGPAVTLFEYKPNVNVKISKITELADDLSLAMSSESLRIIAPIPGRNVVGIETSNSVRGTVYLKEILSTKDFWDEDKKIPIGLGKLADGNPMVVDLRKMPHLLVAGSTGSGKSVFVVSTITSLLMRYSPEDLRLIMVDPKQVDLAAFEGLPHLILPIIKEPKKAISSLRWAIREMDKRYRSMAHFGARNLEDFNDVVAELSEEEIAACESQNETFEELKQNNKTYYFERQAYIVIIVEEFGDLMAVDKSNVESAIVRLAQMARACGIHLILAMQSPRKDVVTGLIKTNIPGRISFKVASKMDSRIILDESGAERLLARGDMLFLSPGVSKPLRAHGSWAPEDVITDIVDHWKAQGEPEYLTDLDQMGEGGSAEEEGGLSGQGDDLDDRYDEILDYVASQKTVSASLLQRRFRLGYPRAARIIEDMEAQGVVGPQQGSKPRKVLISPFNEKDGI